MSIVALWATCYFMLGANLGSLLNGDVSVMICGKWFEHLLASSFFATLIHPK